MARLTNPFKYMQVPSGRRLAGGLASAGVQGLVVTGVSNVLNRPTSEKDKKEIINDGIADTIASGTGAVIGGMLI